LDAGAATERLPPTSDDKAYPKKKMKMNNVARSCRPLTFSPLLDPSGMLGFLPWHHQKGWVFQMGKKHFTEEQIAFALRQAESGTSVAEVIRKLGISEQTFYRWKKRFAGLGIAELRRLRTLEEENKKLKQLVADLSLDKKMLQDVLSKKL
jgi:putative transposase